MGKKGRDALLHSHPPGRKKQPFSYWGAERKGGKAPGRIRAEHDGREETILAWSWRRVYCQEVTPGALNMKRRALVMRKPAYVDRTGTVLIPREALSCRPFLCHSHDWFTHPST